MNTQLKKILLSLVVTITMFAVCYIFFGVRYEENDDIVMSFIAKGYFTKEPDFHLVFINPLIGKTLAFLYTLFPLVGWYDYLLVFLQFTSIFVIVYFLLKIKENSFLILVSVLFPFSYFITNLQFTNVSFLLAFAGIIVFILNENKSLPIYCLGVTLLFISSLIRFEMFIFIIIIGSFYLICNLKTKNAYFALLSLIILISLAKIYEFKAYQSDEWQTFQEFNKIRGKINDNPNTWHNMELLSKERNIDTVEMKLFMQGVYTDTFHTKKTSEIYNTISSSQNTFKGFNDFFYYFRFYHLLEFCLLIIFILAIYYNKLLVIPIILFNLLYLVIMLDGIPKSRVIFGGILTVIILSLIELKKFDINKKYIWLICFLLISYFSLRIIQLQNSDQIVVTELRNDQCYIATNPDNMVRGRDTKPFVGNNLASKNIVIGGWLTNSPLMVKQLENLGISAKPHISLLDNEQINEKCLYIDRNNERATSLFVDLQGYLQKRGKSMIVISKSENLVIYKIEKVK